LTKYDALGDIEKYIIPCPTKSAFGSLDFLLGTLKLIQSRIFCPMGVAGTNPWEEQQDDF
jgi:hypothetical protein